MFVLTTYNSGYCVCAYLSVRLWHKRCWSLSHSLTWLLRLHLLFVYIPWLHLTLCRFLFQFSSIWFSTIKQKYTLLLVPLTSLNVDLILNPSSYSHLEFRDMLSSNYSYSCSTIWKYTSHKAWRNADKLQWDNYLWINWSFLIKSCRYEEHLLVWILSKLSGIYSG